MLSVRKALNKCLCSISNVEIFKRESILKHFLVNCEGQGLERKKASKYRKQKNKETKRNGKILKQKETSRKSTYIFNI